MTNKRGLVKQVSFKKDEVYVLDLLEKSLKPFSFSNYVKRLIMEDMKLIEKNESIKEPEEPKEAANKNDFKIDAEREELEL